MGSTLGTLRKLLEDQIAIPATGTGTDPTSTLLNNYINRSIRKIARRDRPRELMSATASSADITANTNTSTIPSDILVPDIVYYNDGNNNYTRMQYKTLQTLINLSTPSVFFNSSKVGDPSYYTVRGSSMVFDQNFKRTETGAIKVYGVAPPTTLSNDTDETELPTDYDFLIIYESCIFFYQRDDDTENQVKFAQLSENERVQLKNSLDTNEEAEITLDPNVFHGSYTNFSNPNILFSS